MRKTILFSESDCTPWKDVHLEGKLCVLKEKFFNEKFREAKYQLVYIGGGFGCNPDSMGNAIFVYECHNDKPERYRIERYNNDILGIATDEAIKEWKEIYGEFNEEILKYLEGK